MSEPETNAYQAVEIAKLTHQIVRAIQEVAGEHDPLVTAAALRMAAQAYHEQINAQAAFTAMARSLNAIGKQ